MAPRKTHTKSVGRPKDLDKHDAILEAAGYSFIENGYDGTSMDAIAEAGGVSKLTVYSHFKNKESLFKAVIRHECDRHAMNEDAYAKLTLLKPRDALTLVGKSALSLLLNPKALGMHRLIVSEGSKQPRISEWFYEAGPARNIAAFIELLKSLEKQHGLIIKNRPAATRHFFSLLKGDIHMRASINLKPAPTAKQIETHIHECVDIFLKAYGK